MSRDRVRIERGRYRDGLIYYACATPPGNRSAAWKSLSTVRLRLSRKSGWGAVAEDRALRGESSACVKAPHEEGPGLGRPGPYRLAAQLLSSLPSGAATNPEIVVSQ